MVELSGGRMMASSLCSPTVVCAGLCPCFPREGPGGSPACMLRPLALIAAPADVPGQIPVQAHYASFPAVCSWLPLPEFYQVPSAAAPTQAAPPPGADRAVRAQTNPPLWRTMGALLLFLLSIFTIPVPLFFAIALTSICMRLRRSADPTIIDIWYCACRLCDFL